MTPFFDPIMLVMGRAGFRSEGGSAPTPTPTPAAPMVVTSAAVPPLSEGQTADWFNPQTGVLLHIAKVGGKVFGCEMTEL